MLPDDLPVPADDAACAHLLGQRIPLLPPLSASGETITQGAPPGVVV